MTTLKHCGTFREVHDWFYRWLRTRPSRLGSHEFAIMPLGCKEARLLAELGKNLDARESRGFGALLKGLFDGATGDPTQFVEGFWRSFSSVRSEDDISAFASRHQGFDALLTLYRSDVWFHVEGENLVFTYRETADGGYPG